MFKLFLIDFSFFLLRWSLFSQKKRPKWARQVKDPTSDGRVPPWTWAAFDHRAGQQLFFTTLRVGSCWILVQLILGCLQTWRINAESEGILWNELNKQNLGELCSFSSWELSHNKVISNKQVEFHKQQLYWKWLCCYFCGSDDKQVQEMLIPGWAAIHSYHLEET